MRRLLGISVIAAATLAVPATASASGPLEMYEATVSGEQLAQLNAAGFDVAEIDGSGDAQSVDLVLSEADRAALARDGIEAELMRDARGRTVAERADSQAKGGYKVFDDYDGKGGIVDQLTRIAKRYPSVTKLEKIGKTSQGRPILALRVTRESARGAKPAVLYQGTTHAREWISTEVTMRAMRWFIDQRNSRARGLLRSRELWFVPVVNPDGYHTPSRVSASGGRPFATTTATARSPTPTASTSTATTPSAGTTTTRGRRRSPPTTPTAVRALPPSPRPGPTWACSSGSTRPSPSATTPMARCCSTRRVGRCRRPRPTIPSTRPSAAPTPSPPSRASTPTSRPSSIRPTESSPTGPTPIRERSPGRLSSRRDARAAASSSLTSDKKVAREFRINRPFILDLARSAADPADPRSHLGNETKPLYLSTVAADETRAHNPGSDFRFEYSYGGPQPVQVLARRKIGAVKLQFQVNNGPTKTAKTTPARIGERFGLNDYSRYYREMRVEVPAADAGDQVKVWFRSGKARTASFTYEVVVDDPADVLIVAAEDYNGLSSSSAYPLAGRPSYLGYYEDALSASGRSYDVYDIDARGRTAPDALGVLGHYDASSSTPVTI